MRTIFSFMFMIACFINPFEVQAQVEEEDDDDETPLIQDGTKENPFLIATAADLDNIRLREDTVYYYRLIDYIDLSEYDNWEPIGSETFPFKGTFEGDGFSIRNLKIESSDDYVGLFGYMLKASVKDVSLENVQVSGAYYVAAIAGYADECTIAQVFVNGIVHGDMYAGGVVGKAASTYIRDSYSTGKVEAFYYAGGLLGLAVDTTIVNNCYSQAGVLATGDIAGGLVGAFENEISDVQPVISNSVAANVYVTASGYSAGRVAGTEGGDIIYTYGLYTTLVNGQKIRRAQARSIDGVTKTLSDLQSASFYADESLWENEYRWSFYLYWQLDEGNTFPYLQTQVSPAVITAAHSSAIAGRISLREIEDIKLVCYNAQGDSLTTIIPQDDGTWQYDGGFTAGDTLYIVSKAENWPDSYPVSCVVGAFERGNGTLSEPYRITSVEDLEKLRNIPYLQGSFHFRLENDIDLSEAGNFVPIGNDDGGSNDGNRYFEGHFHGGSHLLRHLWIAHEDEDYQGLFGRLDYAGVDSLGLVDVRITGKNKTGALAGEASLSQVAHTFVTGQVRSVLHVAGGLIGKSTDSTAIAGCYASCMVSGQDSIGGLTGIAAGISGISDSYTTGVVSGNNVVGGLAGQTDTPFASCYTTAFVNGNLFTGAFTGYNQGRHVYCYADTTACGQENTVGWDYENDSPVHSLSSRKLAEPLSVQGFEDLWEWREGYFPQLKSFSQSDNLLFRAASALSVVPVFFSEGERAERVRSAFALYPVDAAGNPVHYEGAACNALNDTLTSLQTQLTSDTLFLKDDSHGLIRPLVFVPYHVAPAVDIACVSNGVAYQGVWTNQSVDFSIADRQNLISGPAILQDSIWNQVSNTATSWTTCERVLSFEKDTLAEVYFWPLSQVGIKGNMSKRYEVKIDKTKPRITLSPHPDFMSRTENAVDSVVVQVNYTDNLSGIKEVRWETIDLEPARSGTISFNGQPLTFDKLGQYTLKVTATDLAGNDSIAELALFVRTKRQISSLATLIVNGESIPLQENVFEYALTDTIPFSQPDIPVEATTTDDKATTDNQHTYILQAKNNTIRILVNAEEKGFASTYTVHVYRKNNATSLAGLNIGASNVPLENGMYTYQIAVRSAVSEAQTSYVLTDPDASADIAPTYTLGAVKTITPVSFTVTAESPEISQNYTVYVYRQNNETTLSSLTVHGQSLVLEDHQYTYQLTVPSTVSEVSLFSTLKDANGASDALPAYALSAPGTNTVIAFYVYAEDRNVKQLFQINVHRQSNKAEIGRVIFGGEVYDSGDIPVLQVSCRETAGHIEVLAAENGTVTFVSAGQETSTNTFDLPLPHPGEYALDIRVTPEDNTQLAAVYTLRFSKWFGDEILFSRWNNVIAVRNGDHNYSFNRVRWYKEGNPEALPNDPSKGFIRVEDEGEYYAILEGRGTEGTFTEIRTCPFAFALPDVQISIAPNPVLAGQSLVVTAEMPEHEFERAAILLVTASGAIVMQQPLKGKKTTVNMPSTPGSYILKVVTGSGVTREFKIMVI